MSGVKITACLITLNEESDLPRCLASVLPLVDEVVIIDSGSTDKTVALAQEKGARVIHHKWLGYVGQKNFAIQQATHDWVLSIDADEEISRDLSNSIRAVREQGAGHFAGYEVNRLVFYRGKWIYYGDWYPDRLVRLFRKDAAQFEGGRVHERLMVKGEVARLDGHLFHYTYKDRDDRARRIERYAELWAETAAERGKTAAPWSGPVHAAVRLFKGLVIKRGILDGTVGVEIAWGNAREVWLKYALLRKMRDQR